MSLTPDQADALRDIGATWPEHRAVVIGATALGFYMNMEWRGTADVDLVLAIDFAELGALATRPGWSRHATREHEFRSPRGAQVDVLPAAAELVARGSITWSDGHVMSLDGMDLALARSETHRSQGLDVQVAPPQVVAILKMASYADRAHERERDLADIAHLLDAYVGPDSDRRWEEADDVEFDLAPAYLLGLDIARVAQPRHRTLVTSFLASIEDPDSTAHAVMERRGPLSWRGEDQPLWRRLDAFRKGLDQVAGSGP